MQPIGLLTLNAQPDELLRRDRAGRLPPRPPGARASTSPTTRCCRAGSSPTSTPSSPGWAGRTSPRSRSTARTPPVNDMLRDGMHQHAVHAGVAPYRPNSLDGGCPFLAGDAEDGAFVDVPGHGRRGERRCAPTRRRSTTTSARPGCSGEHDAGRAGAHRRGLHLRARQVLRAGDQGAAAAGAGQDRRGAVRSRSPPAWACRRRSRPSRSADVDAQPRAVAGRAGVAGRRPDGRHRRRPGRRPRRRRRGPREAVLAAGMVPLRDRPARRRARSTALPVQRTFATARSVEFDALLLAGAPAPAPDALPGPRRQGRRSAARRRGPAGAAAGRGVLAARQGDRRLGCRRDRAGRRRVSPAPGRRDGATPVPRR